MREFLYVSGEVTVSVSGFVRLVKSPSGFRKNEPQQQGHNNNNLLVGKQVSLNFSVGDKVPKKTNLTICSHTQVRQKSPAAHVGELGNESICQMT